MSARQARTKEWFKVAHPVRGATRATMEEAMRRILRKKVEPSGEADAVAKRIVRRRIRVTRADAALTHTYASGLPRAAAP